MYPQPASCHPAPPGPGTSEHAPAPTLGPSPHVATAHPAVHLVVVHPGAVARQPRHGATAQAAPALWTVCTLLISNSPGTGCQGPGEAVPALSRHCLPIQGGGSTLASFPLTGSRPPPPVTPQAAEPGAKGPSGSPQQSSQGPSAGEAQWPPDAPEASRRWAEPLQGPSLVSASPPPPSLTDPRLAFLLAFRGKSNPPGRNGICPNEFSESGLKHFGKLQERKYGFDFVEQAQTPEPGPCGLTQTRRATETQTQRATERATEPGERAPVRRPCSHWSWPQREPVLCTWTGACQGHETWVTLPGTAPSLKAHSLAAGRCQWPSA